jgi:hypothetical protein
MSSFASTDTGGKEKKPKKEKKERESAKDRKARREAEKANANGSVDVNIQDLSLLQGGEKMTEEQMRVATFRSVTGVLASSPEMRDVKFDSFSLMVGGNQLVTDCHVEVSECILYLS